MNFGRAFTYAFEDPDWLKKAGIAALVTLIPVIGGITVLGWGLEITRRVIKNEPQTLPDWSGDNFGIYLKNGLKEFAISLAAILPLFIVMGCCYGAIIASTIAMTSANSDNGSSVAGGAVTILMLCMYCIIFIYAIVAGLYIQAAIGTLADTGELGAAFRFAEVVALVRAAPGPYLLSILIVGLTGVVLAPLGTLVCGIGVLASVTYIGLVRDHLYGQAYLVAKATQNAAPIEPVAGV